jgi:hypothetical protein
MLSVSELRTFAITASSGIPCSCGGARQPPHSLRAAVAAAQTSLELVLAPCREPRASPKNSFSGMQPESNNRWFLGKQPAATACLKGGRNSLLESAQEATIRV